MKVAVSGSHGFIGERLCRTLSNQGHLVVRLDREGNLPYLPREVDWIFDIAAYGNFHYQTDIDEIYKANVFRLIKLLKNTKNIKGMVCISSASVILPRTTFYAASKLAIESLIKAWVQQEGTPIVVVRPSTITGPGDAPHHLIPALIGSCASQAKIEFVPQPTHDFLHIEDFVEALLTIIQKADKLKGRVINVSSGKSYSNAFVKNLVEKTLGLKARARIVKHLRPHDFTKWEVDNSEILRLGWKPKKTIENIIEDMVADYFPGG